MSPALADGFLITGPLRRSLKRLKRQQSNLVSGSFLDPDLNKSKPQRDIFLNTQGNLNIGRVLNDTEELLWL